eukprot:5481494-Alexandrium_andersonii.AAC.1
MVQPAPSEEPAPQQQPVVPVAKKERCEKREAHTSHLKYTAPHQRAAKYDVVRARQRAPVARDFLTLSRASPAALVGMMQADGVLQDMCGEPCAFCKDHTGKAGFGRQRRLGHLSIVRGVGDQPGQPIGRDSVCYRCLRCRRRVGVTCGNKLFPQSHGFGAIGVDVQILIQWATVDGWTNLQVMRALNVNESTAGKYMEVARQVLAWDAEARMRK